MSNSINQLSQQPTETSYAKQTVLRVAVILLGATVVVAIFYFFLAFQLGAWQMYTLAGVISVFGIAVLISINLIRRDRPILGLWLIIGELLIIFPVASSLVADVGVILGLALVLLVASIILATQILPQGQARAAIAIGVLVGIVTLLIDVLGNRVSVLSYRLTVSELQTFLPAITGVILLVYGYIILRQFSDYTLQTKFIVTFLAVTLIPLGLLAGVNNFTTRQRLINDANQRLSAGARQTTLVFDTFIKTNLDAVRTEAKLPDFIEYLSESADERVNSTQEAEVITILRALRNKEDQQYITSYALLDNQGKALLDTFTIARDLDKSDRDYFQIPLEKNLDAYVSPVEISPASGEKALYFSSPVRNAERDIIGFLRVRYNAQILQDLSIQSAGLAGAQSFPVLFDENSIHLAHATSPQVILQPVAPLDPSLLTELQAARRLPAILPSDYSTNLPDLQQNLANASSDQPFTAKDIATGNLVNQVAVAKMETQPWVVAFFQPQEVFLAPIVEQTRYTAFLAVAIGIVVVAAAVFVSQRLSGPIIRLTTAAQQVTEGDLSVQSPVESQDETGQLAQAFNSMTAQLRNLVGSLEDQVQDRTNELALSIQVGQRASAIRDLDELLPIITDFIREQFDLYYTHVYFVDDVGQNLVIKAGTGDVGKQLLARHHNLPIGVGSIVGAVALTGQSIIVSDTELSDIHRPNPLLPQTRSELAVPLSIEGRVIGVLDMQASKVNTFTENNLRVFEAMATQLSIAIDSAQQWTRVQETQRKLEEALKQLTHESWNDTLASQKKELGFAYDLSGITPLESKGVKTSNSQANGGVIVPLVVQNESIGQLTVETPPDKPWSDGDQAFLEAVVQQLAQKAETLRLFEDTRQRATREQVARRIIDKIRASRDIKTALNTAAEELAAVLGTARAVIDLKVTQSDELDYSTREIDP